MNILRLENKHVVALLMFVIPVFFSAGQAMSAGYGDPVYGGKSYNRPSQQVQQPAQKQYRDENNDAEQYLQSIATGSQLVATKCPDGEGKFYVTGTRPRIKPEVVSCVDLRFRAYCPGSTQYIQVVAHNFVGLKGCFGDTYEINPKPPCKVDQVRIEVVEARTCGGF